MTLTEGPERGFRSWVKRLALLTAPAAVFGVVGLLACGAPTPPAAPSAEGPSTDSAALAGSAGPMGSSAPSAADEAAAPPSATETAEAKKTSSGGAAPPPAPAAPRQAGYKTLGKGQDEDIVEMNATNCSQLEDKYKDLVLADQRKQRRVDSIKDETKKANAENAAIAEAERVAKPFGDACRENLAGKAAVKTTIQCFQAATSVKGFLACQK
jgi:hypothetical protein